jgi:hypothetical protein
MKFVRWMVGCVRKPHNDDGVTIVWHMVRFALFNAGETINTSYSSNIIDLCVFFQLDELLVLCNNRVHHPTPLLPRNLMRFVYSSRVVAFGLVRSPWAQRDVRSKAFC